VSSAVQSYNMATVEAPRLSCWDGASEDSLARALSMAVTECMEVALIDGNQYSRLLFRPRANGCLRLALTTRSAYRHQVARVFVGALALRIDLSGDLRDRVHTAIQEAMMNSVLHGNLAIDSGLRDSLDGLETSHQTIERLLTSPQIARSMIRVEAIWNASMLYVLVRDSGAGFDRTDLPLPDEVRAAGHIARGRGLAILEAFCDRLALLHGGTTIKLGFRL
jgi:anti-sigma regulatory factor (Ser/Thr protein kinase)